MQYIDYTPLQEDNPNIQEYLNDLLLPYLKRPNDIDQADEQLFTLLSQIQELQNTLDLKKAKLNKELQTALAVTQYNLETKLEEEQQIQKELTNLQNQHNSLSK